MNKFVFELEGGEKLTKKKFLEYFEKKVRKTIRMHKLTGKREKILVAASGGKDSTLALYLMNRIVKHRNVSVEAVYIDVGVPSYSKKNKENLARFCRKHEIKLHSYSFKEELGYTLPQIKTKLQKKGIRWKHCTICGILKRYLLNKAAKELKATRIVTGHNLDDEAQSILMNLFKNNLELLARLGPKVGVAEHKGFVPRIKPLYMCTEKEAELYSKLMRFPVIYEPCPLRKDAYRKEVLMMLDRFDSEYRGTKYGIVNSYLQLMPILKSKFKKGKIRHCRECREPAARDVCNACKIMAFLKK